MSVNADEFFDKLYEEMFPKLKRVAIAKLHNEQTAEDLAQDTLLVAYEKRDKLEQLPKPNKWVYGVLQNKMKHELRSKSRFIVLLDKLKIEYREEQPNDDERFNELLDGLTPHEFKLLYMIYVEGYSNREVAEKLNISYDACRKQVQRAKEKIKKSLL